MLNLSALVGQILDAKYQLDRLLGQGGMGAVYYATHLGTRRPVAVKVIAPRFLTNEEVVQRFRREAEAAGRLLHPNVVNVTDFGVATVRGERIPYLAMEYLDGQTLGALLKEEGPLPVPVTVDIVEQICLAIGHAHRQGVVHRDLKPDNIWLQPDGRGGRIVKVLDFGLAKLRDSGSGGSANAAAELPPIPPGDLDETFCLAPGDETVCDALEEEATEEDSLDSTVISVDEDADGRRHSLDPLGRSAATAEHFADEELTRVGSLLGTPLYMSPEQCSGGALDARSDIYSLGIIIYHMLAGAPPFTGDTAKVISRHLHERPRSLREARPDLSASTVSNIMAILSKDPADRPATAESVAASLRVTAEGEGALYRQGQIGYNEAPLVFQLTSLVALLPFAGLAVLLTRVPDSSWPFFPAGAIGGFLLATLLLLLLGVRVSTGACAILVSRLAQTPEGFRGRAHLFGMAVKSLPSLWIAAPFSLAAGILSLARRGALARSGHVDAALLPCVMSLERLRGRRALERSRDLVAPFRTVASALQVRDVGTCVVGAFYMPCAFALPSLFFPGNGQEIQETLRESAIRYMIIIGGFMMGGMFHTVWAAIPIVHLYRRARQAWEGSTEAEVVRPSGRRRRRPRRARMTTGTLLWYLVPMAMILLVSSVLFGKSESLAVSAEKGRLRTVERLLSSGTTVNAASIDRLTALMNAAGEGQTGIMLVLLQAGADVSARDRSGMDALMHAAEKGRTEAARLLLDHGASVATKDKAGETALILAARTGRPEIVQALLHAGADPAVEDRAKKTALMYAAENGHAEVEELLRAAALTAVIHTSASVQAK